MLSVFVTNPTDLVTFQKLLPKLTWIWLDTAPSNALKKTPMHREKSSRNLSWEWLSRRSILLLGLFAVVRVLASKQNPVPDSCLGHLTSQCRSQIPSFVWRCL